jgi:CRP/FNR family transcriptional regulator, cyclic AMP receptor protein
MKKILLIEDNDAIRENTGEILELANYEVILAENGKVGVEKAIEHHPDLIICDIMMPVLDGYGVLHAVHKNEAIKNTPFIFLTAKTERSDFRKGMELGADDYITKPFDGTELLNAVDSRLKKIDLLKKEVNNGLDGVQDLLQLTNGKNLLKSLTEESNTNKYKKKQIIYAEGNHPIRLYYVISGKVKTVRMHEDGKELITELYSANQFFGHIALLQNTTYKDTAEAMDECEIALIPKEDFENLLHNNKEVSAYFIKLLANNIAEKEEKLVGMAYNSLRKKVAEALLLLSRKYKNQHDQEFTIDISRENLATIAGTATESLIRTLSDFKSEKLIDIQTGQLKIVNEKKLNMLLN